VHVRARKRPRDDEASSASMEAAEPAAAQRGGGEKKRGRPLGSKKSKLAKKGVPKRGAKPRGRPPHGCSWSEKQSAYVNEEQAGVRRVELEEEVDRRVGEHRRRAESSELLWSERTNNGSVDDRHDLGRESSGEDGQREAKQLQGGHIFRRTLIRRRNSAGRAVLVGAHSRQAGYWRVRQRLCFRVHCRHATGMPPDRVPATSMVSSACEKRPGLQRRQSEQGVDGDWQQQQHRDECRVVDTPSERVWRLRRGGARRASLAT